MDRTRVIIGTNNNFSQYEPTVYEQVEFLDSTSSRE